MIVLSWNCRGLGPPPTIPTLCELVRVRRPDVIFLFETLSFGVKLESLRIKLGFKNCFSIDCIGRSGGMAVFWNPNINTSCSVLSYSNNHIDLLVDDYSGNWRLTGYYGFPERYRRHRSWALLRQLASVDSLPWMCIGDYNDILSTEDKSGRVEHPRWLFRGFQEAVADCRLSDVPLSGYRFTWFRGRTEINLVEQRLDRAMGNPEWHHKFPFAKLLNLVAPTSDHNPILLDTSPVVRSVRHRQFRFENRWLMEKDIGEVIKKCWTGFGDLDLLSRLSATRETLLLWGNKADSKFRLDKKALEQRITNLKTTGLGGGHSDFLEARSQLGCLLVQEEVYWRQRAKVYWHRDGDVNSKFFHRTASARKRRNKIVKLRNNEGIWVDSQAGLCQMVGDYFGNLFLPSSPQEGGGTLLDAVNCSISEDQNMELVAPFSMEEFDSAIKSMHPDKAPGPDGFNPAFYHRYWDLVGAEIFRCGVQWLHSNSFPNELMATKIVLIPKIDNPQSVSDLRPISLCNVLYKIISKVLCNRLKKVLPGLVDRAQSAFVSGRTIQDNILMAFEVMHSMKNKTRGARGDVALKIDISKAYDRVNCNFREDVLHRLGFSDTWIGWVMLCVRSVNYMIQVNDDLVGPIIPGRGLRQGDPLSPYLFILCTEGLSAALNRECGEGRLHGYSICRGAPPISHLLFTDDSLFFCRANVMECTTLKNLLNDYERISGQAINLAKSGIFFSRNVTGIRRQELKDILGVSNPLNTGRYLGLPSLIGRNKREIFSYVKDRLTAKLRSWRERKLSKAGKEILIKSVAQAIPTYCMTTFLLPSSLLDELNVMMNKFWWESSGESAKGVKWMRWERICVAKDKGGRGFRDLHLFNLALLGKMAWRLINEPDSLVCRVLKAKYFPNDNFLSANMGSNPSFTWYSIHASQGLIRKSVRWKVGNGESVSVWGCPWLNSDLDFYVRTDCLSGLEQLPVSALMEEDMNVWNKEVVSSLFDETDADRILKTPLAPSSVPDCLIWHYSKDGRYSVKSGYNLASDLVFDCNLAAEGDWKRIWRLKVPPKIKDFLWRACRNCLPTKVNLFQKKIVENKLCVLCERDLETNWHLFINCPFAEDCWKKADLMKILEVKFHNCESFADLVFSMIRQEEAEMGEGFCMLLHQIWRSRNLLIWENQRPSAMEVVTSSAAYLAEWRRAQVVRERGVARQNQQAKCRAWHRPPAGFWKVNVDVAFFSESDQTGTGMVLRDDSGNFVMGRSIVWTGCKDVELGEAMGFYEALSWIKSLGISKVILEGDSKIVVDAIKTDHSYLSVFGDVISACKAILAEVPSISIGFVCRDANIMAHSLARMSRSFEFSHVWYDPPISVVGLPTVSCSCN